jgi:hypothetical protein
MKRVGLLIIGIGQCSTTTPYLHKLCHDVRADGPVVLANGPVILATEYRPPTRCSVTPRRVLRAAGVPASATGEMSLVLFIDDALATLQRATAQFYRRRPRSSRAAKASPVRISDLQEELESAHETAVSPR